MLTKNLQIRGKEKYFCICCGKEIKSKTYDKRKYCSNKCQQNYEYQEWIKNIKKITLQLNLLYGDRSLRNYADIFLKNSIINAVNVAGIK